MATARNLISTIRSSHKLLSTDSLLTDRGILAEIKIARNLLIKRELNLRKLWQTDSIFTTIPCLEMIEVSISECCDYVDPCSVARTRVELPRISEGNYQYVIQGVYSINAMSGKGKKLKEISINRYINLLKLPVIKNEEFFWITNGYLYVNNPMLRAIRFVAFFEEDVNNDIMYPECGCGTPEYTTDEICKNPLDKEFALPGYLEQQTLQMTSQKLLSTYFGIKTDISADGIDGQAPNSKPNS